MGPEKTEGNGTLNPTFSALSRSPVVGHPNTERQKNRSPEKSTAKNPPWEFAYVFIFTFIFTRRVFHQNKKITTP